MTDNIQKPGRKSTIEERVTREELIGRWFNEFAPRDSGSAETIHATPASEIIERAAQSAVERVKAGNANKGPKR